MDNANPYAAPQALVQDMDAHNTGFQEVHAFHYKGRIGRMRYMAYTMVVYLATIVLTTVLTLIFGALNLSLEAAETVASIGCAIALALLTIQRSHDMNWSGWTSLLAMVPFVGLVWIFKSGTRTENDYGLPTPPNSRGVKLLGLALPLLILVISVVMLVAVAVPAYQEYVQRAKAREAQRLPVPPPAAP